MRSCRVWRRDPRSSCEPGGPRGEQRPIGPRLGAARRLAQRGGEPLLGEVEGLPPGETERSSSSPEEADRRSALRLFRVPDGQHRGCYRPADGARASKQTAGLWQLASITSTAEATTCEADSVANASTASTAGHWRPTTTVQWRAGPRPHRTARHQHSAAAEASAASAGHWRPGPWPHRAGQQQRRAAARFAAATAGHKRPRCWPHRTGRHQRSAAAEASATSAGHWRPGPWPHRAGQQQRRAAARLAAATAGHWRLAATTAGHWRPR